MSGLTPLEQAVRGARGGLMSLAKAFEKEGMIPEAIRTTTLVKTWFDDEEAELHKYIGKRQLEPTKIEPTKPVTFPVPAVAPAEDQ